LFFIVNTPTVAPYHPNKKKFATAGITTSSLISKKRPHHAGVEKSHSQFSCRSLKLKSKVPISVSPPLAFSVFCVQVNSWSLYVPSVSFWEIQD